MTLHVTFKVGNANYVVPAADVLHLESFESATHVPGAPSYVAGLVQVRSRLVPVVDLRARFGLPAIEHSIDRRVVVVQSGTRVAGFLVDSAREVMQIEESAFEKPPELIEDQVNGFVKGVATVSSRLLLLVDIPRIIGEELRHGESS
jgi:purine-binding chemotaxis protein CheW